MARQYTRKKRNIERKHYKKQKGGFGQNTKAATKTKRAFCNPNARKNKIANNTCFTPKSIDLLKEYYNQNNPGSMIQSKEPKDILREIQLNTNQKCKEDICLINEFAKSKRDQNVLKALLFPPPRPEKWDQDPDTWLTNFDIMDVLNQYETAYPNFAFIGPSPINYNTRLSGIKCVCPKLCQLNLSKYLNHIDPKRGVPIDKIGIVFNLDPHHKSGSHWVSMFIDLVDNFVFFFNSTGSRIPKRINNLVIDVIRQGEKLTPPKKMVFHQNTNTAHQKANTECGMYCMYFIITMLLREKEINYTSTESKKLSVSELIHLFKGTKGNPRIPDAQVFKKRNEYYSAL